MKLIKEVSPEGLKCSNEARDLIMSCLNEFLRMLSAEANETCTKRKRQIIAPEDVFGALETLEMPAFLEKLQAALDEHNEEAATLREHRKSAKKEKESIPLEELKRQQALMFSQARDQLLHSRSVSLGTDAPAMDMGGAATAAAAEPAEH